MADASPTTKYPDTLKRLPNLAADPQAWFERISAVEHQGKVESSRRRRLQTAANARAWRAQRARDVAAVVDADGTVVAYATKDGASKLGEASLVPDARPVAIPFGCITHQTNMFVDQTANGIWGLHGDGADSVLQALYEGGAIGELAFSLCYEPVDPRSKSSLRSGFFVVGGVDVTHHVHDMQFAELKVTGAFYAVETLSVSLVGAQGDEVSVEAPAGEWNRGNGLVVDSGTTDMYLPRRAGEAWVRAWSKVYPRWTYDADKTFTMHENELSALPSIRFRFRGVEGEVEVDVRPESFVEKEDRSCSGTCSYFARVYLEEAERRLLQEAQSTVAHCPMSNSMIRSGMLNVRRLLSEGVRVSLGTDVSGGASPSMLTATTSTPRSAARAFIAMSWRARVAPGVAM